LDGCAKSCFEEERSRLANLVRRGPQCAVELPERPRKQSFDTALSDPEEPGDIVIAQPKVGAE